MADVDKETGNACMAVGDYVNAMKWYSQAMTVAPRDAALYSNRSFAFLKLGLPERALADADEAIRRRPDWAKAHFRKAEALSQAHVHTDALQAYAEGARLDASDVHLQSQCAEAAARLAAQRRTEQLQVAACALVGLLVLWLLLLAPGAAETAETGGARAGAGAAGYLYLWRRLGALFGAALGGAGGAGAVALRRHLRRLELPRVRVRDLSRSSSPTLALTFALTLVLTHLRRGATLPPLQSNEHFAALQMRGDTGGAGPLRSKVLERPLAESGHAAAAAAAAATAAPGAGTAAVGKPDAAAGGKAGARVRSTQNGRAAAMKAMGKGK